MGCSDEHPMGQRPEDRRRADAIIDQAIDELTPMVASKGACETVGDVPLFVELLWWPPFLHFGIRR